MVFQKEQKGSGFSVFSMLTAEAGGRTVLPAQEPNHLTDADGRAHVELFA